MKRNDCFELFDSCHAFPESLRWVKKSQRVGGVGAEYARVRLRGSSTVFLRPLNEIEGAFRLESQGTGFGDSGFYRMAQSGTQGRWRVRYLSSLHEKLHLYVDANGVLRTDHTISFMGLTVLRLHYRMSKRAAGQC